MTKRTKSLKFFSILLLVQITILALAPSTVLAVDLPNDTYADEEDFINTLDGIITGRVVGFIPRGTNITVTPDASGIFELREFNMPPVRISVGGVKAIIEEKDLGQIVVQSVDVNGTKQQTASFATRYKLSFELLFQTAISNINDYVGAYRSDITRQICGCYYLVFTQWILQEQSCVSLPNYYRPSDYLSKIDKVAEGSVIIEWSINMDNTYAPAEYIDTDLGQWIRNDLFSYWVGVKGATMGDIVSEGIGGYYTIEAVQDLQALQQQLDNQIERMYTASKSGTSRSVSGWYAGLAEPLTGIDRINGTWQSTESGTPLYMARDRYTNETTPSDIPYYDPSLGSYLLKGYTYSYMKVAPRITEWTTSHKIYHGILNLWFLNSEYSRIDPWTNLERIPTSLGFTYGNAFRRQEIIVNMEVRSYYDFHPTVDIVGGLTDTNENNGNRGTDVFGYGSLTGEIQVTNFIEGLIWLIIILIVVIAVIYIIYRLLRGRREEIKLKIEGAPTEVTKGEKAISHIKWIAIAIIAVVFIILFTFFILPTILPLFT